MSQMTYASLWCSFNNLCAQMLSLCYIAGAVIWAKAFVLGIAVSAAMTMLHLAASS